MLSRTAGAKLPGAAKNRGGNPLRLVRNIAKRNIFPGSARRNASPGILPTADGAESPGDGEIRLLPAQVQLFTYAPAAQIPQSHQHPDAGEKFGNQFHFLMPPDQKSQTTNTPSFSAASGSMGFAMG